MFTACPFDVHTKTTWGPQQPIPAANMTVGLAATLHVWDCAPPLFPPCPAMLHCCPHPISSCPPQTPSTQPPISHAKAHLALQDQAFHSRSQSHYDANSFGNNSAQWNWHTIHSKKKPHCPLTLSFRNKNDRQGESFLYVRSPLDWSKKEGKRANEA